MMQTNLKHCALCWLCIIFLVCIFSGCTSAKHAERINRYKLTDSELNESRAFAHYCQGRILEDLNGLQDEKTLWQYLQTIELDPNNKSLYAKTAYGLMLNQRPSESLDLLLKASKRFPNSTKIYSNLAHAYTYIGEHDLAIRSYLKALELHPKETKIYIKLGILYFDMDLDQKALKILDQGLALASSPNPIRKFCYNQGLQFIENNENVRAMPCFELVANYSPEHRPEIYHFVGNLYENLKLNNEAMQSYQLACAETTPLAESYIRLALLHTRNDINLAIETLKEGMHNLPNNIYIILALAQMYSLEKDYQSAMKSYALAWEHATQQDGVKLNPAFYLSFGAICEQEKYYADAATLFESCLQEYPESHEALNYLSYLWAEQGYNLNQALKYINRAIALDPNNGAYLDTLGWVYFKKKMFNDALYYIKKAQDYYPQDPTINDHLGDTWKSLGEHERALYHWIESYKVDSNNNEVALKLKANGMHLEELAKIKEEALSTVVDSNAMPETKLMGPSDVTAARPTSTTQVSKNKHLSDKNFSAPPTQNQ